MKIKKEKSQPEKVDALGVKSWGIWECEPSSFDWSYDEDETCLILEGQAKITAPDETVTIEAGDLVIFPKGLKCRWQVDKKNQEVL
ncbi:protein containing DUF861, cupin-3 [sediment metagenome]|uniref:Protein containing DUF861, cupin-3 n=1 Tax=sediment metagenome TaxID=749907 RepID=D9PH39_9ZZZZ